MLLDDDRIFTVWKCDDPDCDEYKEIVEINIKFFRDNKTPMCCGCNCDMIYDYTYYNGEPTREEE